MTRKMYELQTNSRGYTHTRTLVIHIYKHIQKIMSNDVIQNSVNLSKLAFFFITSVNDFQARPTFNDKGKFILHMSFAEDSPI